MKILTILAATCAAILPATVSYSADLYQVAAGATVTINEHGTCKKVTNGGGNPIMVPTRSANEWMAGKNAFLNNVATMNGVSVSNCIYAPVQDSIYNSDCLNLDSLDDGYLDVCYYMGEMETLLAHARSNGYQTFKIDYLDALKNASSAARSYNAKYWNSSYFGVINSGIDGQIVITRDSFQTMISNDKWSAYVCGVLATSPGVYWGTNDNGFVPVGGYSASYSILCE